MGSTGRIAVLVAGALALAGCGGGDDTAAEGEPTRDAATTTAAGTTAPDEEATGTATGSVTVDTASTDLGDVLVDGQGMTLYLFDDDSEGESACTGGCAETWPPLIGEAEAAGGADASLLDTITRPDGSTQVTYDGHPLYLYAPDSEPGDVTGQGVGGVWWVVGPDGSRITAEASEASRPDY